MVKEKKENSTITFKKISVIKSKKLFTDLLIITNFLEGSSSESDDKKIINWKISPLLKKIVEDSLKKHLEGHPIKNNDEFIKFKRHYEIIKDNNQKNTTFDLELKKHGILESISKEYDMKISELIKSIFFTYIKEHQNELEAGKEILTKINNNKKIKKEEVR